jgi:hypothetical protein
VYRFAPLVGIYGGTLGVPNMIAQYMLGLGKLAHKAAGAEEGFVDLSNLLDRSRFAICQQSAKHRTLDGATNHFYFSSN